MQTRKRCEIADTSSPKLLSLDDACARYSFGRATMRRAAQDAGAEIRIGRTYRVNIDRLDRYFDSISE